jgi:hypothetical protein
MEKDKKTPGETGSDNNEITTNTVALNSKTITKTIKWSPENELIMVEWCDIAQCYKWLHSKCHRKLANRQAWFTIPAIALSTISGTASFAQASLPPDIQLYAPMAIGTINILIGISTTIQQYLKISELNESHRISAISWDKFARNIRIELAKDPDERMDAGQFLKICRAEFDRLMETSPSIDERTVQDFNYAFQGEETAKQKKEQEILQQKRFYELRKPDICNIIVSANESRHHWYKDPNRVNMMNTMYEDSLMDIEAYQNYDEQIKHQLEEVLNEQKQKEEEEEKKKREEEEEKIRIKEKEEAKRTELELLTQKIKEQNNLLNEYIVAFVESVGRKPDVDEIRINMIERVDPDILESFLKDYNLDSYMNL